MKFEEYCRQANPEVSEVQTWTRSGQRIVRPLCRFFPQEKKGLVRLLKHRKEGGWWKEAARKRNMGQEGGEPAITWKKSRGKGVKKRKKKLVSWNLWEASDYHDDVWVWWDSMAKQWIKARTLQSSLLYQLPTARFLRFAEKPIRKGTECL